MDGAIKLLFQARNRVAAASKGGRRQANSGKGERDAKAERDGKTEDDSGETAGSKSGNERREVQPDAKDSALYAFQGKGVSDKEAGAEMEVTSATADAAANQVHTPLRVTHTRFICEVARTRGFHPRARR